MLQVLERLPRYKNNRTYYRCVCECGNEKIISDSGLTSGKGLSCGCDNKSGKSRRKDWVGKKFNRLTIEELYYNYKNKGSTYAKCQCECGNKKIIYLHNIISEKTKSCGCFEKESRYFRKHSIDITGQKFGKLTALEISQVDKEGKTLWKCLCDCGNTHITSYTSLKNGGCRSCGCNRTSQYEENVHSILHDLNIPYDSQFTFANCRNILPLPFDFHFYYKNKEYCIEVQGQQHYIPVKGWGGEETLLKTRKRDNIKYNYCIDNDIILIVLPYTYTKEQMKQTIIDNFPL